MRTIAIVPLLLLAFTLVGKSAHAENVLYCQSELATGFYKDDEKGSLDYRAYLSFLRSLKDHELPVLERWLEEFLEE